MVPTGRHSTAAATPPPCSCATWVAPPSGRADSTGRTDPFAQSFQRRDELVLDAEVPEPVDDDELRARHQLGGVARVDRIADHIAAAVQHGDRTLDRRDVEGDPPGSVGDP